LLQHSRRTLVRNWWPAVAWIGVLFLESTDLASSRNTGSLLQAVLRFFLPHLDESIIELLNHVLRKTGHFLGYGILSVLVFYALKNTNRDRLRAVTKRVWGTYLRDFWRMEWAFLGVMSAIGMATYDEIHQTFIPSRTGRWQDVVIDTSGAIAMQIVVYLVAKRAMRRGETMTPEPQVTTSA